MRYLITIIVLFLYLPALKSQEVVHKIKSYEADGKIYWNKKLPVYLRIASTPDGEGHLLKSDKQEKYSNPIYLDTEGINFIRTRWAVDPTTLKAILPQTEILMEVYADSRSPVTKLTISSAPTKTRNDTVYYGIGLDVSITSSDALSGIENIFYKLNSDSYSKYGDTLNFQNEGSYTLGYYGLDNVGNFTKPREKKFVVDLTTPITYHNINGLAIDDVISTSTKLYFTGEDSLSGVSKTYYKFDGGDYRTYTGKSLDISKLAEGEHTLNYYSIDYVKNKEEVREFKFYYDKTAPIMAADILGDRFISGNQVYFSGRTKLKLTAVDNKVGVKKIMYSVNNEPFKKYEKPFYLPSVSGEHLIRYYSEDNLSNVSSGKISGGSAEQFKHNVNKVYVDLTGPDINYSYVGKSHRARDTVFINKETKVLFNGVDPESGIGRFTYNLDGNSEELVYNEPFTLSEEGFHLIAYFGYDKVNNRNIGSFFLYSDHIGPAIHSNFSIEPYESKNGLNVYARDVDLFLAATDDKVGLSKIYYKIDDGSYKEFVSKVKGFKKNKKYKITVKAVDILDNETLKTIEFYTGK